MAKPERSNHEVKQEVLRAAREMLKSGLVEGTAGNISGRLPDGNVVMTPSSLAYDVMQLEDLVVMDLQGNVVEGERPATTEKALHLACLRAHDDIHGVIHSHPIFATMFAVTHQPIPCVIEEFEIYVGGEVPVAHYQLTGSDQLGEEVARWVGDRSAVLMANHGLLTAGASATKAMEVAELVERTAKIVWGARMLGDVVPLPDTTRERFAPIYKLLRSS